MVWRLASEGNWNGDQVYGLLEHVIQNASSMLLDSLVLCAHIICTNLSKLSSGDVMVVRQACGTLIDHIARRLDSYTFNAAQLVDVILCIVSGVPLPSTVLSALAASSEDQSTYSIRERAQLFSLGCYPVEETLQWNGFHAATSGLMDNIASRLFLSLSEDFALVTISRHQEAKNISRGVASTFACLKAKQNEILQLERFLSIEWFPISKECAEYMGERANSFVSFVSNAVAEESGDGEIPDDIITCANVIIRIQARITELLSISQVHLQPFVLDSISLFVNCIDVAVLAGNLDFAYLLGNRLLTLLPASLALNIEPSKDLYSCLWSIAKCSLEQAIQIEDDGCIKKSLSTDSSDDPAAGVGDWLENILNAVPALMDQQEAALSSRKASFFATSSAALMELCERCICILQQSKNPHLVWTEVGYDTFRAVCAVCGSERVQRVPPNVVDRLSSLFAIAVETSAIDHYRKDGLVTELLCITKESGERWITSSQFCLNMASVAAFSRELAMKTVSFLINCVGTTNCDAFGDVHFWLLECLAETLNVHELRKAMRDTVVILHEALQSSFAKRAWVRLLIQTTYALILGGSSYQNPKKSLQKFRKLSSEKYELTRVREWTEVKLTREEIGFMSSWDELYSSLIEWLQKSYWSEEPLPLVALLPPPPSFFARFRHKKATESDCYHYVCIRTLLEDKNYAEFVFKFNDEDASIDITDFVQCVRFDAVTSQILGKTVPSYFSVISYDMFFLMINQYKRLNETGRLDLFEIFANRVSDRAVRRMIVDVGRLRSIPACQIAIQIANSSLLLAKLPQADSELRSFIGEPMLKAVREWSKGLCPPLRSGTLQPKVLDASGEAFMSPASVCAFPLEYENTELALLNPLYDNIVRFCLQCLSTGDFDTLERDFDWVLTVQSSLLTSAAAYELSSALTTRVDPSFLCSKELFHVISALLEGILQPNLQEEHKGAAVLSSILAQFVSSPTTGSLPWDSIPANFFSDYLDRVIVQRELDQQTAHLITFFIEIPSSNNPALSSIFLRPLCTRLHLLERWIKASRNPLETFYSMRKLFEFFGNEGSSKQMSKLLDSLCKNIINEILCRNVYRRLVTYSKLSVQLSDRWGYSAFFWKRKELEDNQQVESVSLLGPSILLLLKVGGSQLHNLIIDRCIKLFAQIVDDIDNESLSILAGHHDVEKKPLRALVYFLIFIADIMEYFVSICQAMQPIAVNEESDESSSAVTPKHFVKTQSSSTTKGRTALPLCTYGTTAKQFVPQHWYNCYTCNMKDGEGVCSVCAVNCHRNHDISYGRHSSFFCDCGAKGCAALKSVTHPRPRIEEKQKDTVSSTNENDTTVEKAEKGNPFSSVNLDGCDLEAIKKLLGDFMKLLEEKGEKITALFTSISRSIEARSYSAYEASLRRGHEMLSRGVLVKTERCLMKLWMAPQKAIFDKKAETSRNLQNYLGTIECDGSTMLATVQDGSKITLLSTSSLLCSSSDTKEIDLPRIDLESVGFKVLALACHNDLLVACGSNQFLVLRFNKDGDVTERSSIEFKNLTPNNAIVKVAWVTPAPKRMVAIATQQFVRIYDVCSFDHEPKVEFVLPLGNVVDIAFGLRCDRSIDIFVLSSVGHVYREGLAGAGSVDGSSYFMTETLLLPESSSAVSMHYSLTTRFLFVSLTDATYALRFNENNQFGEAIDVPVEFPVSQWSECCGVLSAVGQPNCTKLAFLYLFEGTLFVQSVAVPRAIHANCMVMSANGTSMLAIQIIENQTLQIFRSNWNYEPDFWVKDFEYCVIEGEPRLDLTAEENVDDADTVTIFESCDVIEKVEFSSKALELSYDSEELTKRLNTASMSAVCLKKKEFDITVKNLDWNWVICALRVEVSPDKCPSSVSFFNRTVPLQTERPRMFDLRLTRKQSLTCNNEVTLYFTCDSPPAQVLSIKVYGKTKKVFGFPTATYRLEQALALPERMVASILCACYNIKKVCGNCDSAAALMKSSALRFAAPGFQHADLSRRARELLRLVCSNISKYYFHKDAMLFSYLRDRGSFNASLMNSAAVHLKHMIVARPSQFHQNVKQYFGDVISFLKLLCAIICTNPTGSDPLLECFLFITFAYVGACHVQSSEMTQLIYTLLFSEDVVLAHRFKYGISVCVSTYCAISIRSHMEPFTNSSSPNLEEQLAVLPFLNENHADSTAAFCPAVVAKLKSELEDCEVLKNETDGEQVPALEAFCRENEWVGQLLIGLVKQLDSIDIEGIRCIAATQTALLLIGQHSAEQLPQVMDFLIGGIDFSSRCLDQTAKSEREQLILRLIGVVLAQCITRSSSNEELKKHRVDGSRQETPTEGTPEQVIGANVRLLESRLDAAVTEGSVDGDDIGEESETEQLANAILGEMPLSRDVTPIRADVDALSVEESAETHDRLARHESSPQMELAYKMANSLISSGASDYCFECLNLLSEKWLPTSKSPQPTSISVIPPDMQPDLAPLFNLRSLQVTAENVFKSYDVLVSETALRLPYQLKKILRDELELGEKWKQLLCSYISQESAPNRRLARKLLLLICDSDKAKYRQARDEHVVLNLISSVMDILKSRSSLTYCELSGVVSRLGAVASVSEHRNSVWRKICATKFSWLLKLATIIPELACNSVLNLILLAFRDPKDESEEALCCSLADSIISNSDTFELFKLMICRFLLNEKEDRRWMMHATLRSTFQFASRPNQTLLFSYLYKSSWCEHGQRLGHRADQLVDLLACYIPRFLAKEELMRIYADVMSTLDSSLSSLHAMRNSVLFRKLAEVIGTPDLSVLSVDPCLVCSDQEIPLEHLKLSAIKLDSRFTTSAQMIKLMGHFEISQVLIRLTDIKRSKMIKRVKLFYCNKVLESAVDLKNRAELWEEAADVKVGQGDSEIDIQLPIPILTCNIVLEITEFYEAAGAGRDNAAEVVHCPRCSTAVAPNPGVCSGCGENVFQCVKCRAINYDEKDPFLCNACGFCKYARLESTIVGRLLPPVQTIEDDNDLKATKTQMENLLREIETRRCEINIVRSLLEKCSWDAEPCLRPNMLLKHAAEEPFNQFMLSLHLEEDFSLASLYNNAIKLNKKIISQTRQLAALKAEMQRYDCESGRSNRLSLPIIDSCYLCPKSCANCMSVFVIHCITLMHAICRNLDIVQELLSGEDIFNRLVSAGHLGGSVAVSAHNLISFLADMNEEAMRRMCELAQSRHIPSYLLAKSFFTNDFQFWEQKLRCLLRMAVTSEEGAEVNLQAIAVLHKICSPTDPEANSAVNKVGDFIFRSDEGELITENAPSASSNAQSASVREDAGGCGKSVGAPIKMSSTEFPESTAATSDNPCISDKEDNDDADLKDLLVDNLLNKDDLDALSGEESNNCSFEALKEVILGQRAFPVISWLKGRFTWVGYGEKAGNAEDDSSILAFINECCKGETSAENPVARWLKDCMFSSVSMIRFATYRLLIAMCFHANGDGTFELGSPVDISLVVGRALYWLQLTRSIASDRLREYFCLLKTLASVPVIRKVLVGEPVSLHVDVAKRILIECMTIRLNEVNNTPSDLSTGNLLLELINLLNSLMADTRGWLVLEDSYAKLLPSLIRSSGELAVVGFHRTRHTDEAMTELGVLIMRIAMKRPVFVLCAAIQCLNGHKELALHAHFLRLISNIVLPLVKKEEDFLIQIEKDPLQEEYLQGRMLGNPYKSGDAGMGPLMRDVKNKICRDCELVALLDDDNGMELLVNQQIIALDLPVSEVYEKLWRKEHPDQPMTIIYRMRGLLGDATEPFVKSISDANSKESEDSEQLRLASRLGDPVRGLSVIIRVLDLVTSENLKAHGKELLREAHRLLSYCIKVDINRQQLIENDGISRCLNVFSTIFRSNWRKDDALEVIALQYVELANALLIDVLAKDQSEKSTGGANFEQTTWLLELSMADRADMSLPLWEAITSLVPNLCVCNTESMNALVETFRPCCDWLQIDKERKFREVVTKKLDTLCAITNAIHASAAGGLLKQKLMDAGLVADACHYLSANHPPLVNASVEGPEWKQFLAKPSLKYVLKLLAGMARMHKPSQEAIAETSLPILHRLELISSTEHIGTLAENVIEELKRNEKVSAKIEKVRQETKSKRRELAMAMRKKQLSRMGMKMSDEGQVKVASRKFFHEAQAAEITTDTLAVCCICREGLDAAEKIMMVYAFASRQNLNVNLGGKNFSFSTVSQMNFVHMDCHTIAVRMAGSRDEWASAALHNANTKCNVIVPIWSAGVKESDMESALQRLSSDLDAAVGCGTLNVDTLSADIAETIDRFVKFRSFSDLSLGGGRESNAQYLNVLLLLALRAYGASSNISFSNPQSLAHRMCTYLIADSTQEWNARRLQVMEDIRASTPKWEDAKPNLFTWFIINFFHNNVLNFPSADRVQKVRENFVASVRKCAELVDLFDSVVSQSQNFEAFIAHTGFRDEALEVIHFDEH